MFESENLELLEEGTEIFTQIKRRDKANVFEEMQELRLSVQKPPLYSVPISYSLRQPQLRFLSL